jgi:hypothetical protein
VATGRRDLRLFGVRASDADRERAVGELELHFLAGRLDALELAERTDEAYAARSVGELEIVVRELPDGREPLRLSFRAHLAIYFAVNALLLAVWAMTVAPDTRPTDAGAGRIWPIWVMILWGGVLLAHGMRGLWRLDGSAHLRRPREDRPPRF